MSIAKLWFAKSPSCYKLDNSARKTVIPSLAILLVAAPLLITNAIAQTPPPKLGEETKGTPAFEETAPLPKAETEATESAATNQSNTPDEDESFLGTAKITESRRENGQIYEIELEHSLGGKQYIQENDSDGKIESTSNDLEETPNLPKWKLGSW